MKNIKNNYAKTIGLLAMVFITALSCERDISDEAVPASFAATSEVFLDGFSGGMQFQAFGDIFNFEVDNDVAYKGIASMRFAVPAEGETGSFAGGNFFTGGENADGIPFYAGGRDLSGFDALTFWAKSSMPAEINEVGFGLNPDQGDVFRVSLKNLAVNTNWKKYYIPIPDASKVTAEQGLFYYFESPEDGIGYTFWIDELQFEKLGTILLVESKIFGGADDASATGFNNVNIPVSGVSALYSLPDGTQQALDLTPSYFDYTASVPNIVSGDNLGSIAPSGLGTTALTASLDGKKSQGTLTVESLGDFKFAPTPAQDAADVISVFSNAYNNVSVEYFNGFWGGSTTLSDDFEINGDDILNYTNFNYVGTSFLGDPIDASETSFIHFDIFIPGDVDGAQLEIVVRDIGADGVDGGSDDTDVKVTLASFTAGEWNDVDIPLDATFKDNIGLIIYANLGSTLTNFWVDNIYFY